MVAGGTARGGDLGTVEDRFFEIRDFRLQNGMVMPRVTLAYETCGELAADGRNAVLMTHGYTNGHHAAGHNPANGNQPGWWDGLIGPGKAIDTGRPTWFRPTCSVRPPARPTAPASTRIPAGPMGPIFRR